MQLLRFRYEQLRTANSELTADWLHGYLRHFEGKMAAQAPFIRRDFLSSEYMHIRKLKAEIQIYQYNRRKANMILHQQMLLRQREDHSYALDRAIVSLGLISQRADGGLLEPVL